MQGVTWCRHILVTKIREYLVAQLAEELLSFRYFVHSPKELFCEPAPSDGR